METITELTARYPELSGCAEALEQAVELLIKSFRSGGRLYTCGNGGSAADADHIVGELMKGFLDKRPLSEALKRRLVEAGAEPEMTEQLQWGLPAISLHSQSAFMTAFMNDVEPSLVYAQALLALGRDGDVLVAISTSGNSENVVNAAVTARALGMKVIALTGARECRLDRYADAAIHVGAVETYRVQELHLPAYHWLCAEIEKNAFEA